MLIQSPPILNTCFCRLETLYHCRRCDFTPFRIKTWVYKEKMVIKIVILKILLVLNIIPEVGFSQSTIENGTYEIVRIQSYTGKSLEAAYKINYRSSTNSLRFFEVIKTDTHIKSYFLADFLLIEKIKGCSKMICYPTGWESLKSIKEIELRETCQLIIRGKIVSEAME